MGIPPTPLSTRLVLFKISFKLHKKTKKPKKKSIIGFENLGIQLGAGCFGRVVKAEAVGMDGSGKHAKTVAVKMVRSQTNVVALEALVSEMKILMHLASHLNVVNLLGACTKDIDKGNHFQTKN
jgi:hypothetical protein